MLKNILFLTKSSSQFSSSYLQAMALKEYLATCNINSDLIANSDVGRIEFNQTLSAKYPIIAVHFESLDYNLLARQFHNIDKKIMIYHGITPAKYFWSTKPQTAFLSLLGQLQLRFNCTLFDCATACSPYTVNELRSAGFSQTLWLPCYIEERRCEFREYDPKHLFEMLFVGRIAENKGILELFSAVERLVQSTNSRIRLTIVGSLKHNPTYGRQVQAAIEKIRERGIRCENFANLSLKELNALYMRSHLYISHAFHEGFGIPAMDAIQYGIPAIYTACGGQESVLNNLGCAGTTTEELVDLAANLLIDEQARWRLWQEQKKRSRGVADVFRQTMHKLFIAENVSI